ncbi:MAG TPA: DUF6662 family protein [Myxococcales bacterium]|jgi:hypothetical protein|nr:DUF6662 family protein [Myxococcales bacterium]
MILRINWALGVGLAVLAAGAAGSERKFTFTQETAVLNPGDRELEPWSTFRIGRTEPFTALDQRVEFEVGVLPRLQTAWYLNFTGEVSGTGATFAEGFEFQGISWEWKYKLLDPVADPVGLALYLELSGGPADQEVEGKVLLDKRFGPVLAAFNLVAAHEWESEATGVERELEVETDLAAAWLFDSGLSAGLELRTHSGFPVDSGWESTSVFVGPALSYSSKSWWAALSVMPQVLAFQPAGSPAGLDLTHHEAFHARLIFGWQL